MSYGFVIKNEVTARAFDEGYSALYFVGSGYTTRMSDAKYRQYMTYVDFYCPTKPILFYRSQEDGAVTIPHYVYDYGGGRYRAFVMGDAEVFCFSSQQPQTRGDYGVQIFGGNGNLVFDSNNRTLKPYAMVTFPALNPDEASAWNSGTSRKLAYALLGNAVIGYFDFGRKTMNMYRSAVRTNSNGFELQLRSVFNGSYDNSISYRDLAGQSNKDPIQMMVIDVSGF